MIAFALVLFHRYRTATILFLVALSWVLLCSTPAFAEYLRSGLIANYPQIPATSYPTADVIVVLGGGYPMHTRHDSDVETSLAGTTRVGFGLELYRAKRAPTMLLTGGEGSAMGMSRQLAENGVPLDAMQLERRSLTTYEDAAYSAELLHKKHQDRILLVTSVWAMRRALACFRKQGIQVIPAPALESNRKHLVSYPWWPQRSALQQSGRYLHEYIGFLVYKVRGWA